MPIVSVIFVLIVIGVLLYLINKYIPMDIKIKKILNVVVVVAVIIWLLSFFVNLHSLNSIRI